MPANRTQPPAKADEQQRPRERMVETQLAARDIADPRVLDAMRQVPRHLFVDEGLLDRAYWDGPLPIGHGQTISQPYIVALMTQALGLRGTERVLEVGFGCGYQTAVLARLASEVYAVERIAALFEKGRANLRAQGIENVRLKLGDGSLGWEEHAPFDAVLVAAYTRNVPELLRSQLSTCGRLIIPLGDRDSQLLVLYGKNAHGEVTRKVMAACRFVPLVKNGSP
ncbi:MAG: protein-L-isoaspartate(D-aspartate) O-methyltransferase [Deltaproteobacteria bacterium]|jgi:protein-L-isoaspartate(D-aspartate) O-methyltransferase|nr:protein-L-isoaspartate(D-aspartate) O-methyltransferase [Deltaproteobacteria bacterium]